MLINDFVYTFIASFMALFPVLNPIGNAFVVNGFLEGLDEVQRSKIVRKIALNCLLIGLGSLIAGKLILLLFGLAVPVIQLAGGILIGKMGFDWLSGPAGNENGGGHHALGSIDMYKIEQQVFYPISFPVCFGPGSISVIFTLMAGASVKGWVPTGINYVIIALVIAILCGILYFLISRGNKLANRLGHSGSLVLNKLVAFFTFCIGIQIVITGLSKIFHLHVL